MAGLGDMGKNSGDRTAEGVGPFQEDLVEDIRRREDMAAEAALEQTDFGSTEGEPPGFLA